MGTSPLGSAEVAAEDDGVVLGVVVVISVGVGTGGMVSGGRVTAVDRVGDGVGEAGAGTPVDGIGAADNDALADGTGAGGDVETVG